MMLKTSVSKERGANFEHLVWTLLEGVANERPGKIVVKSHPSLVLHNGQTVIPDFELRYELPFETDLRLIECQDRLRSSQDVLHKIRSIRTISPRNRFIFIYRNRRAVSDAFRQSLEADGVVHYDIYEFAAFLEALSDSLGKFDFPMRREPLLPKRLIDLVTYWEVGQVHGIRKPFAKPLSRRRGERAVESESVKAQMDEIERRRVEEMIRNQSWRKPDGVRLGGWKP